MLVSACFGQADPSFTSFKGDYYKIPARQLNMNYQYSKKIYDYEKRGTVEYPEINFPDALNDDPFPGTELTEALCMVLFSQMTISDDGCYEFELKSDDGSRLWIDSTHVVNNDKTHGMRAKRESIFLRKGNYQAKLWYAQAYASRYGFMFNATFTEQECTDSILTKNLEPIVLNANVLFDHDSANLKEEGMVYLKEVLATIDFSAL